MFCAKRIVIKPSIHLNPLAHIVAVAAAVIVLVFIKSSVAEPPDSAAPRMVIHSVSLHNVFDYDRTFGPSLSIDGGYSFSYKALFKLAGGFAANTASSGTRAVFAEAYFTGIPLGVLHIDPGFKFLLLDYSAYNKTYNSYIPHLRVSVNQFFMTAGVVIRYLDADGWGTAALSRFTENQLYWNVGGSITWAPWHYRCTLDIGTFDSFYAGNTGIFRLFARNQWKPTGRFAVLLDLGFMPAGTIAIASTFHHFYCSLGGEFSL